MSLVVSDTTPINYLVLLRLDHVLHELYGQLFIPPAVLRELQHAGSPEAVRRWANHLPAWVTVKQPTSPFVDDRLGTGELESIALAKELPATLLLLDDRAARRVALNNGLLVAGTVGVLENAAEQGLVDLKISRALLGVLLRQTFVFNLRSSPTRLHGLSVRKASNLSGQARGHFFAFGP